jgi:hypothetical protein
MLDYGEPPRRRRWIGPVLGLLVTLGLIAGVVVLADSQLRSFAAGAVAAPLASALGVDESDVDVDFGSGLLITQLPSGSLDEVAISVSKVPIGPATPSLTMTATGVPLSTSGMIGRVIAQLRFSSTDLQPLTEAIGGDAATGIDIANGEVVVTSEQNIGDDGVPVVVQFAPSIDAGALRLVVVGLTVDGDDLDLDRVSAGKYGSTAAALVDDRNVCLAELLPAVLVPTAAVVEGDTMVVTVRGSDVAIAGSSLTTKGSC